MKLIIGGTSLFSEIASAYFERNGDEVIGFFVEDGYNKTKTYLGKPVYSEDDLAVLKGVATHFYVAITYIGMNTVRARVKDKLKGCGLEPASYISNRAYLDPSVKLGEHIFIFEDNVVQYGCRIDDNSVLWSGNHIGHHSKISANTFVSSHCVISGSCVIGKNTFIGVNSTISNDITIGDFCWIQPNVTITSDIADDKIILNKSETQESKVSAKRYFRVKNV